ncbi:MAG TPA: DUF5069 domain-containing protein [Candidatus Rubrimentiphilum sp.]|nr:DUF5069 domain-containing protein [Candidatus Rubrimentiphilum sp.]
MEPLDLTKRPPRSPRAELDGLANLPRTIDKMRALLPGGSPGVYKIAGFSARMLETVGVTEDQFREAVKQAKTDEDVAVWLRAHSDPSKYAEWNDRLLNRRVADIQAASADFLTRYPIAERRPDIEYMVDLLEADDAEMFAKT